MALSGITVADDCVSEFTNLQKHHINRYVMYKIENNNLVVVDKIGCKKEQTGAPEDQFAAFTEKLMATDGAYAVYDVEYITSEGVKREKVLFILWCPGSGTIKTRMLYASTKDTIRKKFNGIHIEIQANDTDDLKWESIVEKIEQRYK